MHTSSTRRIAALCGFMAVAAATVTGCSDDSSGATDEGTTAIATTTSTTAAAAAAAVADEAVSQEVTDVYLAFFDGKTPAATRASLVENGDVFLPVLEGMAAQPQSLATTATVEGVTAVGSDAAEVSWTLLMDAAPVLPDQSGEAVRQDGQWKVAAVTFCTLMAIQGSGGELPGC